MPRKSGYLFLCFLFLSSTALGSTAHADVKPRIFIGFPANGAGIHDDPPVVSPFYEPSDETVAITGIFSGVPQTLIDRGDVFISVNGATEPASFSFTGSTIVDGVEYRSGTFFQRTPVLNNPLWPMRKIVAEIVNTKTFAALARDQISLYDLRGDAQATPNEPVQTEIHGMTAQLTDAGLGYDAEHDAERNMEVVSDSMLPDPSLAAYNELLGDRARSIARYQGGADDLKACIKYTKLKEKNFQDKSKFKAFKKVMSEAKNQLSEYRARKAACDTLANPAAIEGCKIEADLEFCVKSKPKAKDFELCVDRVEGQVNGLTSKPVSEIGMNFEDGGESGLRGLLSASATVAGMEGTVTGYLRDLSIRWRDSLCPRRPRESVDDSYITRTSWLNRWATCKNMTVAEGRIHNKEDPSIYAFRHSTDDVEVPRVSLEREGDFAFLIPSHNSQKGTCKETFINPYVDPVVESFRPNLQSTFQSTWNLNSPATMEAEVLTKIAAPLALGTVTLPDHDLFAAFDGIFSRPLSGLELTWRNDLRGLDADGRALQKSEWFHSPTRGTPFSTDGRDHLGARFEFSYSITTALLNRILNVRVSQPGGLFLRYRPTWDELSEFGVSRPAGAAGDDHADLTGAALRQFDIGFLSVGNRELQIELEPLIDPIVFMPPDLQAAFEIPAVGAPTVYGMESLQVTFKERDQTVNGQTVRGKTWLRLVGGFVDLNFNFSLPVKSQAKFLTPNMDSDAWGFNIIENELTGCLLNFSGPAAGPSACEDRIERKIARLIKNALHDRLVTYLSHVPVPIEFDGEGEAKRKLKMVAGSRSQINQYITFYSPFQERES